MDSEETFNEKFATIDEALKYISDSQAKSEWLNKREEVEHRKFRKEMEQFQEQFQKEHEQFRTESAQRWKQIEKNVAYITKLTGIAFDDLDFQNKKLLEVGKTLGRQNPAIERNS